METLDLLIEIAMITKKSIKSEEEKQQDPMTRINRQLAKGEILIEIYSLIQKIKDNG